MYRSVHGAAALLGQASRAQQAAAWCAGLARGELCAGWPRKVCKTYEIAIRGGGGAERQSPVF